MTTSTYDALSRRMSFLSGRQAVIAGNIANADTPGYLAKDMVMKPAAAPSAFGMVMTNLRHLPTSHASADLGRMTEDSSYIEHNGNSVRLDEQMVKLGQVQGEYRLMTELYAKQAALQKMAIGKQ